MPAVLAAAVALLALLGSGDGRTPPGLPLPALNGSAALPHHGRDGILSLRAPSDLAAAAAARPSTPVANDLAAAAARASTPVANDRPLIGILTQACHRCPGKSYIAGAYTKWIEAAGGRAVPLRYYVSDNELRRLFDTVNGIIFPGGLTDLHLSDPYTVAARKLYGWAKESADSGVPFPIWGTCLGHQLLLILESGAHFEDLLTPTDAVSHPSSIIHAPGARASRLMGPLFEDRPALAAALADPAAAIVMENHEFGLPAAAMDPANSTWPQLPAAFSLLATARDRKGLEYVATIEHKRYPFYGTQWHPEKPPYEFSDRTIPKSHAAISVSHYLGDRFMDAARGVPHKPVSEEQELNDLVYVQSKLVFTAKEAVMEPSYDGPDSVYFFDRSDAPHEQKHVKEAGEVAA